MHRQVHSSRNVLLRHLDAADLARLAPHFHSTFLELRAPLETAGKPIECVYFVESGLISVVAKKRNGLDAEVGIIGFEGMTGSALVMGDDRATHDCFVQMTCEALVIEATPFQAALNESKTLQKLLLRYVHALHIQATYTALINARSSLEQRLARWLLMCDDRVVGNRIGITHEYLSVMLGVRRPGVTIGLQVMEGKGFDPVATGRSHHSRPGRAR